MAKDLTDESRAFIVRLAQDLVDGLNSDEQSLGIAREVLINAYDEAAAEVDRAQ